MLNSPVIILVKPQLAENIGAAARAMFNGGLKRMRLVAPRSGWPDPQALRTSTGAYKVLDDAEVFESTRTAIADLKIIYATTARIRDMNKPVFEPWQAVQNLYEAALQGVQGGILFGPERSGLENEDISLANGLIHVPLNPEFTSLNLAQAVLIMAYEWFKNLGLNPYKLNAKPQPELASKAELLEFFDQLENELDRSGFLRVAHKRPIMVRNLRNIFQRVPLTSQEIRTLRGVIASLAHPYFQNEQE